MSEHPTWGGEREGAGRPALYDTPMVKCTVTLPPDIADGLRELGGGNLSAGVRKLWELWQLRPHDDESTLPTA